MVPDLMPQGQDISFVALAMGLNYYLKCQSLLGGSTRKNFIRYKGDMPNDLKRLKH